MYKDIICDNNIKGERWSCNRAECLYFDTMLVLLKLGCCKILIVSSR